MREAKTVELAAEASAGIQPWSTDTQRAAVDALAKEKCQSYKAGSARTACLDRASASAGKP